MHLNCTGGGISINLLDGCSFQQFAKCAQERKTDQIKTFHIVMRDVIREEPVNLHATMNVPVMKLMWLRLGGIASFLFQM